MEKWGRGGDGKEGAEAMKTGKRKRSLLFRSATSSQCRDKKIELNVEECKATSVPHLCFHHHDHRNGERDNRFPNPNGLHPHLATLALFKMAASYQISLWIDWELRIKDSSKVVKGCCPWLMLPHVHLRGEICQRHAIGVLDFGRG